jgi:6-phosphogluconolactonase
METTKVIPGQLVAMNDPDEVAAEAARRIARALRASIKRHGETTLAISGGNTPRAAFERLAKEPDVEWGSVDIFWVDERAVPPDDDRSNYRWAKSALLDKIDIPASQVHRMPADAEDREAAARAYEALLKARLHLGTDGVPSFDVMVLGVGEDGHTASIFPGEATVDDTEHLVAAVPAKGDREARLTLTPPVIERAKVVIVLAVGASKRPALERVWPAAGDVHDAPARILRGCRGSVVWIIDRNASGVP